MEYGVNEPKVILAGILTILMMCAATAPAFAQADAQGGNVSIQVQYCPQVVNQYANADQNNSGDAIAAGIAQNIGITQSAVNNCLQNAFPQETSTLETTETTETTAPETPTSEAEENSVTTTEKQGEQIVMSDKLPTVLANTGGTASPPDDASLSTKVAMLLPAGALLVVFGAAMFCVRSWRA